ncbi:helix-turn-helix domain-containing protein [Streptomyces sp. NPDC058382]|uniref:helix-turn-helix domain-containing protein n=1 Tax=unclassified Streptomyces TaxID=2593676 RepID=UPI00362C8FD0
MVARHTPGVSRERDARGAVDQVRRRSGWPGKRAPLRRAPGGVEAWRSFGVRLRQWRRRAELAHTQVGARVGDDHTAISKLEHGSRRTPLPPARRLDDLLMTDGDPPAACEEAAR